MKKLTLIFVGAFILLALAVATSQAQSGNCNGAAGCADSVEFNSVSDLNGWGVNPTGNTSVTVLSWYSEKDFGWGPWLTQADGVLSLQGNNSVYIEKSINLSPGRYHLQLRAALNPTSMGDPGQSLTVFYTPPGLPSGSIFFSDNIVGAGWAVKTSQQFQINDVGDTGFEIGFAPMAPNIAAFFDYIYIIRDGDATPIWNGTGTPATPTPIPSTATAMATAAPYCVAVVATATPGPGQFGTPTITPTPTPVDSFSYVDTFDYPGYPSDPWSAVGNVYVYINTGHNGNGAAVIAYSPITETIENRTALVFDAGAPITPTFYIDGWTKADFTSAGITESLKIFTYELVYEQWSLAETVPVDHVSWQPFHVAVASSGVSAIAFVAERSDDGPGNLFLDDVDIYKPLANGPRCDGSYPPGTGNLSHPGGGLPPVGTIGIWVPESKPCPGSISRPNNFWGALFAQITYFLDVMFAGTPYHNAGALRGMSQQLLLSPFGALLVLASSLFDFTLPLQAAGVCLVMFAVYLVILTWKFLRRATVQ